MRRPRRCGYHDLNLPISPSTSTATRSECLLELSRYGHEVVCHSTEVHGGIKQHHRCSVKPLDLGIGGKDGARKQVKQMNRITVHCDSMADAKQLNVGNDILSSYDVVVARTANADIFVNLCEKATVDMVSLDLTCRLPLGINEKVIHCAIARGLSFEVCYSPALRSGVTRRRFFANMQALLRFTRGRRIILSSGAESAAHTRSPLDVANLGVLLGMSQDTALNALTINPAFVLESAAARRNGVSLPSGVRLQVGSSLEENPELAAQLQCPKFDEREVEEEEHMGVDFMAMDETSSGDED